MIDWKNELNEQQLRAVCYDKGPLLVLAGAGSGKTRVLTYRVAWLIDQGRVKAEDILLLTFTNKAAGEMRQRVEQLVGKRIGFAGTFHAFCAQLLRKYGERVGLGRNYVIYDETDKKELIKTIVKELGFDERELKPAMVMAMIGNAKNEMLGVGDYAEMARGFSQKQVAQVWERYEMRMRESNAVDFDDLLRLGVRLLEIDEVGERMRAEYSQILIDEYQDTNRAQYRLTTLLDGKRGNLTVVGDFSQSIYSWRGADYRNLNLLKQEYANLETVKLEENYRSTQRILDAAYGVIGNNTGHPILELKAIGKLGDKVMTYEAKNEREEAKFVIEKMNGEYGKYAVLYRTNAQSRSLEEAMIRAGVPYVLVGGVKFYERKEIKDVLAYLRVIANEVDMLSWQRIEKLGKRRADKFKGWLETVRGRGELSTEELLMGVLENSGLVEKFDRNNEADLARLENIQELMSVAKEFSDLNSFLENVALVQSEAQSSLDLDKGVVTLMTVHAAKGLEFSEVFVVGLEEGLFPHSRSIIDKDQLEEERRLMYVAMTRAKEKLYLSYARQRLFFGQRNNGSPSRFLSEIPENLVETVRNRTPAYVDRGRKKESNGWRVVSEWETAPKPVNGRVVEELVSDDFDEIDSW
jgi:DNA helicase-2/ATP-dependent DNA helicase PcrA